MTELSSLFKQDTPDEIIPKKVIALIVFGMILVFEIMFAYSLFTENSQNSKIVYSEKAPTPDSKLAYGNSGPLELEPFSGKILHSYRVPNIPNNFQNIRLQLLASGLVTFACLSFLGYKIQKLEQASQHYGQKI